MQIDKGRVIHVLNLVPRHEDVGEWNIEPCILTSELDGSEWYLFHTNTVLVHVCNLKNFYMQYHKFCSRKFLFLQIFKVCLSFL